MTDVEQIFEAIQRLPVPERLRLVERVVHDLADASATEPQLPPTEGEPSLLGLFADDPEAIDDMMRTVMENRRRSRLRDVGGDDDEGSP
jgi:hypothetical protein